MLHPRSTDFKLSARGAGGYYYVSDQARVTHPRCWRRPAPGRAAPRPRGPPPTTSPPPPPPFRLARQAGPTTSPTHGPAGPPSSQTGAALRPELRGAARSAAPPPASPPLNPARSELTTSSSSPISLSLLSNGDDIFFFSFSPRRILQSEMECGGSARVYVCMSRPT